jgi:P-type E1-E2 ATPase
MGILSAIAVLATSIIMLVFGAGFSDSDQKGALITKKLIENLTLALIVIVVAIPEGLPMTVMISIAGSVRNMYKDDKILVRELWGPEKMGEVTEILCGKTGTMTTEQMEVISLFT